jgi:hypothetical protein
MGRTLYGSTNERTGPVAVIRTGLRVDKPRAKSLTKRKGTVLSSKRAANEVMLMRAAQVGNLSAAASLSKCEGRWMDGPGEPTLVCEIEHIPSEREKGTRTFRNHMITLGEQIAERFGQHEVWVKIDNNLYRTNAPDERGPKPLRAKGKVMR